MARLSKVNKHEKQLEIVAKYRSKRKELRATMNNVRLSDEERVAARKALLKLPKLSWEARVRNRCKLTGRPRAYMRKFALSRMAFRELALKGQIPGVTKSSW